MVNTYAQEESYPLIGRFWAQAPAARPLFGFRVAFKEEDASTPGILSPEAFSDEQILSSIEERYSRMQNIRGDGPWAAEVKPDFPWIPAMLGCEIKQHAGAYQVSLGGMTIEEITRQSFSLQQPWADKYFTLHDTLKVQAEGRYPVAFPIFPGGFEALSSILGEKETQERIASDAAGTSALVRRINSFILEATREAVRRWASLQGGHVLSHSFLWCPGPCLVYRDSSFSLAPDEALREAERIPQEMPEFKKLFIQISSHALRGAEPLLNLPGYHGVIVTGSEEGPPLSDLLPFLLRIQEKEKTLILSFPPDTEDLDFILQQLSAESLFVCFQVGTLQEAVFWSRYFVRKNLLVSANAGTEADEADLSGCS